MSSLHSEIKGSVKHTPSPLDSRPSPTIHDFTPLAQQELDGLLDDLDDLLDDFFHDDGASATPSLAPPTKQENPIPTVNHAVKEHTVDDQVLSFGKHAHTPPSRETMLCSAPDCDADFRGWRVKPKGTVSAEKQH